MAEIELFNVWRRPLVTHASAGNEKTLCGVDCPSYAYDEGDFIDMVEPDLYVSCTRCQKAIAKLQEKNDG